MSPNLKNFLEVMKTALFYLLVSLGMVVWVF